MTLGLSERWRQAAVEKYVANDGGVVVPADAAVRVVLEHLIDEAGVLCIPDVAAAYMRRLLEEIQ